MNPPNDIHAAEHLSDEELFDITSGIADAALQQRSAAHTAQCDRCAERVAIVEKWTPAMRTAAQQAIPHIPEGLSTMVHASLDRERRLANASSRMRMPRWRLALNIALGAVLAGAMGAAVVNIALRDDQLTITTSEVASKPASADTAEKSRRASDETAALADQKRDTDESTDLTAGGVAPESNALQESAAQPIETRSCTDTRDGTTVDVEFRNDEPVEPLPPYLECPDPDDK